SSPPWPNGGPRRRRSRTSPPPTPSAMSSPRPGSSSRTRPTDTATTSARAEDSNVGRGHEPATPNASHRNHMASNSRSGGSKKGPAKGSGGKNRRSLRGKGPTPKAEDRVYHKAYRAAQNRKNQNASAQAKPKKREHGPN